MLTPLAGEKHFIGDLHLSVTSAGQDSSFWRLPRKLNKRRNLRQLALSELRKRYAMSLAMPQLSLVSKVRNWFIPAKTMVNKKRNTAQR
jgi:hypothetical protein